MSNEIAIYKLSDMQVMAEAVARSGLFGMKTPDQALALMLVAQAENQHPATITQDYDIIKEGLPEDAQRYVSLSADGWQGRVARTERRNC